MPTPEEMIRAAQARDEERAAEAFRGYLKLAEIEVRDEEHAAELWGAFYAGTLWRRTGELDGPRPEHVDVASRLIERVTTPRAELLARQRARHQRMSDD